MPNEANIKPQTLQAARLRARLELEELASKLGISGGADRLDAWERGLARPTFVQARNLARILRVPFASLFLDVSALGSDAVPDLRTIGRRAPPSVDLLDVYRDAQRKVDWARDIRQQQGFAPIAFVGEGHQTRGEGPTPEVVRAGSLAIVKLLQLRSEDRDDAGDPDGYARLLVRRAEDAGLLILRSSTVGANTHRRLKVKEFRGFAISDAWAPLVFVNTADAKTAQLFTLMHELAHIWRAETGISQSALEPTEEGERDTEAACDAIAAEVLVPGALFRKRWDPTEGLAVNADRLRRTYKVSGMVIARRALDHGLVSRAEFDPYFAEQLRIASARPERDGGPSQAIMVPLRNSPAFTDMVARAALGGELLWRDAARLLGMSAGALARMIDGGGREPIG